jgi:hypothetical protein
MILQLTQTEIYYSNSFYWLVSDVELLQFTDDFCLYWKKGTELYGNKVRELKKLKPIGISEGNEVIEQLRARLKSTLVK